MPAPKVQSGLVEPYFVKKILAMNQKEFVNILLAAAIMIVIVAGAVGCFVPYQGAGGSPTPPLTSQLSPTELKYRLLDGFGEIFYCDPDFYPVARRDERELAVERFPDIQKDADRLQTILRRNNLEEIAAFSDEQKLLIYREHKKLNAISLEPAAAGYKFNLRVAEKDKLSGSEIEGFISESGSITVSKKEPTSITCPICLSRGTLIDTPLGFLKVNELKEGTPVWTVDAFGIRRLGTILETVSRPVAVGHLMVHLVLNDGREIYVSPGHPTPDGRKIGDLSLGDIVDGGCVVSAKRIPYREAYTYDILPSGETGLYWANGIPVKSTLVAIGLDQE